MYIIYTGMLQMQYLLHTQHRVQENGSTCYIPAINICAYQATASISLFFATPNFLANLFVIGSEDPRRVQTHNNDNTNNLQPML